MTGLRLACIIFRKFNGFVRLWENHFACTACMSQRRSLVLADLQSSDVYYRASLTGMLIINPVNGLKSHHAKIFWHPIRLKSDKRSKNRRKQTLQGDDDDDDDDDDDNDDDDLEKTLFKEEGEEDPNLPKDYKDIVKVVQSFRYDVIMKAGLDIARNKVEEAFYENNLRLNGEKLWKKSRAVKVGDTLDLIVEQDKSAEMLTVMRIVVKNVAEDKTATEKYKVLLRRWKRLKLPNQDILK